MFSIELLLLSPNVSLLFLSPLYPSKDEVKHLTQMSNKRGILIQCRPELHWLAVWDEVNDFLSEEKSN